MKRCRLNLVLLNIMLNPIFVVVVYVDCFLKYSCAVRPLICFGLYICGILMMVMHLLAVSETSLMQKRRGGGAYGVYFSSFPQ